MPRFKVCKSFRIVKTAKGPVKRCRGFKNVSGLSGLDARLRGSRKRKSRKLSGYEGLEARLRKARKRRRSLRGLGMVEGMASKCARHKLVRSKTGKKVLRCAHFVHGPGVMAYAARKKSGVKRPVSDRALWRREARAQAIRQGKYFPKALKKITSRARRMKLAA